MKILKDFHDKSALFSVRTALDTIIPELRESEDEKVRKDVKRAISVALDYSYFDKETANNCLAWLEKQGKQKSYGQRKECLDCQFNYAGECKGSCAMKRNEQKPSNKIVPKFQNGQWIVLQNKCYKVNDNGCGYELIDQNGLSTSLEYGTVDKSAHLWAIQGAKDGDLLACENGWTCIFKTLVNDETFSSYCFMDNTKWFCETGSESHTLREEFVKAYNGKIHPATKEQRDLLFQKMKEAGYEWDASNKELRKHTGWSEEDEYNLQCWIAKANYDIQKGNIGRNEELIDWLKSLRNRVKPQPDMVEALRTEYEKGRADIIAEMEKEWSEEDEKMLEGIVNTVKDVRCQSLLSEIEIYDDYIDWLKSLKDRYTWSPSSEQIDILEHFIRSIGESGYASPYDNNTKLLYSLLEQLKKLKA